MKTIRRLLFVAVLCVPLLGLMGAGSVKALQEEHDEHDPDPELDPGVPYDHDAEIEPGVGVSPSEDPCTPILDGGTAEVDELELAGLEPGMVPQFLVDEYELGAIYCLSDLMAGVVEGVYTELWSGDTVVARWLIPGTPNAGAETWEQYLASLTGGGDPQRLDHGVISILPSGESDAIEAEVAELDQSDYVSLWPQVATELGLR